MKFEEPKMNVITFSEVDVIATSNSESLIGVNGNGTAQNNKNVSYDGLFKN